MKYFLLAGEKSGDLHGSNIIKAIKLQDPDAQFFAWGGELMEEAGANLLMHYKEMSIMGIIGVIKNLRRIKHFFQLVKGQLLDIQPDTVLFIDYGGFNLKAAKIAKQLGFHTQFYIAPKVWAWNYARIYAVKKWIDELYVIFPFEKAIFEKEGISTHFEGNPIMDEIKSFQKDLNFVSSEKLNKPYIALLPGSRKQEITKLLPIFEALAEQNPQFTFVVAGVKELQELFADTSLKVVYGKTYQIVSHAQMAIVCSGTATLETALLQTPLVVVYKTDPLFYRLAKWFVKLNYISLVNIILNKPAIPELIQSEASVERITEKINQLFPEESSIRKLQLTDFKTLYAQMGDDKVSDRLAKIMVEKTKQFLGNS